jgi:ABC-type polysaccharide/polyol phosphate export permease
LLVIPGLLLALLTGVWVGLLLGLLCARFGDLPQVIASVVQIAFFITPVIYKAEPASGRLWVATHLNPFASYLALLRDPLLGEVPQATHYAMAALVMVGGIVYWL